MTEQDQKPDLQDNAPSFAAQLARLEPDGAGGGRIDFDASWTTGRTVYGGLGVATCLRAMRAVVDPSRPPRALQVMFPGPVAPGEAVIKSRVLRAGKAMTQVTCELSQAGQAGLMVMANFGADRDSAVRVPAAPRPEMISADEAGEREMPYIPGAMPAFLQHMQLRYVEGDWPYTGSALSTLSGWCRSRHADGDQGAEGIVAFADTWPPSVLQMQKTPAPSPTASWMLEFPNPAAELNMDDWACYQGMTYAAGNGYAHIRALVWNTRGELVAISHQTVALFA